MKRYIIKNTEDISEAEFGYVDQWPWDYDYEPVTAFRVVHNDSKFILSLRCYEKDPVAHIDYRNGFVCNDSCMEFFFSPSADCSAGYFNFEMNSRPAFFLGYAEYKGAQDVLVDWPEEDFKLHTTYAKDEEGRDFWQVDSEIPYDMIRKYVPDCDLSSGRVIRGNAYKCGTHDQPDHYGTWSPVDTPTPNFHCPEFFGELVIE